MYRIGVLLLCLKLATVINSECGKERIGKEEIYRKLYDLKKKILSKNISNHRLPPRSNAI